MPPDITAVTRVAAGHIRLHGWHASALHHRHALSGERVAGSGVESKPWLWRVEVTSATQLEVYLHKLSSALGRATWAADDTSFDGSPSTCATAVRRDAAAPVGVGTGSLTAACGGRRSPHPATAPVRSPSTRLFHPGQPSKQFLVEHNADGTHTRGRWRANSARAGSCTAGTYDIIDEPGVNTFTLEAAAGR